MLLTIVGGAVFDGLKITWASNSSVFETSNVCVFDGLKITWASNIVKKG